MTVRCEPENFTRLAFSVGKRPSPASITPAFTSSSLNFIILPTSSWLGIVPASEFLSPGTNTMTRIAMLLWEWLEVGTRTSRAHARVEHRSDFALALESRPVLSVQLHELGRDS